MLLKGHSGRSRLSLLFAVTLQVVRLILFALNLALCASFLNYLSKIITTFNLFATELSSSYYTYLFTIAKFRSYIERAKAIITKGRYVLHWYQRTPTILPMLFFVFEIIYVLLYFSFLIIKISHLIFVKHALLLLYRTFK